MEAISITALRANIYALFDRIDQTGKPQLVIRNGELYELRKRKRSGKNLTKRKDRINDLRKIKPLDCMTEPPEWYISPKLYEWSGEIDPNIR